MDMIKGRVETEREIVVRKIVSGKRPSVKLSERVYKGWEIAAAFDQFRRAQGGGE